MELSAAVLRKLIVTGKANLMDNRVDDNEGRQSIAARTTTEKKLAAIWRDILDTDPIGIYDNFVDLGGHSILAIRCFNRMRDAFQVDLPLSVLFNDLGNIREIAQLIDKLGRVHTKTTILG